MAEHEGNGDERTVTLPSARGGRPPRARLVCVDTNALNDGPGREVLLERAEVTVGRGDENTVALKANGVSKRHARIYPGDQGWGVEDLASTNGIFVNKSKVQQAWLKDGDILTVGTVHYKFSVASADDAGARTAAKQVDIADFEKTMIMRPGVKAVADEASDRVEQPQPPAARPAPAPKAPAQAAPAKPAATRASAGKAKAARATPHASEPAGGGSQWLVILVVVVLAAGAAAFLLM